MGHRPWGEAWSRNKGGESQSWSEWIKERDHPSTAAGRLDFEAGLIIPTRFPDMGSLEWTEAHLCADRDPTHARSAYIDLPIPGCPAD